ncbi:MAG: CoB--CoM heterodisulfide reductase iron-sulfur subunit C [Methanobacterium sp. PtaU1.Bin097]|jgi:heterodisulfide reductase subunit C|nr:MAG: CoB--CoM heterodisulfide reductase iron-sulfur subunit C [Methanobacterium sp. PtaU1.Bin097]
MEIKTLKIGKKKNKLTESIIHDLRASEDIGVNKCIQCGMCTSVCPASRHSDYDSREIAKRVLEEDESVICDDIIWNCFSCYSCHSVCPVGNSVAEIVQILRQKAIAQGKLEQVVIFLVFGESLMELGVGSIPLEYFNILIEIIGDEYLDIKINLDDIREELGLGKLTLPEDDTRDIKIILEKTGFTGRLEKLRAYKESSKNSKHKG